MQVVQWVQILESIWKKTNIYIYSFMMLWLMRNINIVLWLVICLAKDIATWQSSIGSLIGKTVTYFCKNNSKRSITSTIVCSGRYNVLPSTLHSKIRYMNVCSDLIVNNLPANKHWIPRCFIRTDIAHF